MNAGIKQRKTYKSFLKSVFELSARIYGESYWKSPLMVNNIWISNLFLDVSSNRVDTKIDYFLEIKGYLREIIRFLALKAESSLVRITFGLNSNLSGHENVVLTFVDERCYTDGIYKDVFTGNLTKNLEGKILIMPVFVKLSILKKFRFYRYLYVSQTPVHLAIHNIRVPKYFREIQPEAVIIDEVDFTRNFVNELSYLKFKGISTDKAFESFSELDLTGVQKIYYPFENQLWERCLCHSVSINKTFDGTLVGLQNAPVSLLSLRYIFPDNWNKYYPSPDEIIARDEISYRRLYEHWGKRCLVRKGINQRKFIRLDNDHMKFSEDVFVALSIGIAESRALLKFIESNCLPGIMYFVAIHPLLPDNLKRMLINLAEKEPQIQMVDYENGLKRCGYVMSTTSTALLEGLYNGLLPLKYVHNSFVSASPLDFNRKYDDFVSFGSRFELKRLIENVDFKKKTQCVKKELQQLIDGNVSIED